MAEITTKSTKNEILEAYEQALKQLKEAKTMPRQEERRETEKQLIVKEATRHTTDDIFKGLTDLKLTVIKSLEELEEKLISKHKEFTTLQQAIELQNKELEDIYQIKVNADSLTALLLAQKEKARMFEEEKAKQQTLLTDEMAQKRSQWKKEQEDAEFLRKENELQLKKMRQREEDDYLYKRDLERQKEQDQYAARKQALEKELIDQRNALEREFAARERTITEQEQYLQELKLQVETFPTRLQNAIAETERNVSERLQFKHEYEAKLAQKEVEGEKKLYQQMISALETKIAQQEQQIKQLTEKANQAGAQVQEIAVKAIESTAGQRYYSGYSEKSETTK
jgi:hypothetical protein